MAKQRLVLPPLTTVQQIVRSLVDKPVEAIADKFVVGSKESLFVATYVDDNDKMRYLGLFDLPCATYLAAGLMLVPADEAQQSIAANKLEESLRESFCEVANVCAALFNLPHAPPVRFHQLHVRPPQLPRTILKSIKAARARRQVRIDIKEYGSGNLAWLVV